MSQIKKDEIDGFLKKSDELLDAQREAVHKLKTRMSTPAEGKTKEAAKERKTQEAMAEVDGTSQRLRLEMQKARMLLKYQSKDNEYLLGECQRAWKIAQNLGYEPENADWVQFCTWDVRWVCAIAALKKQIC